MKNIKKFVLLAFVMLAGMNGLEAKKAGKITNRSSHLIYVTPLGTSGNRSYSSFSLCIGCSTSNQSGAVAVAAIPTDTALSSIHLAPTPIGYDGSYLIKDSADGQSLILTFTDGTTIVPPLS